MGRQRYDKIHKDWVPIEEWYARRAVDPADALPTSATVAKSFEAFKSTVDGSVISDRRQLAAHNKKHGVTNIEDYGQKHFDDSGKRMYNERIGNTAEGEKDRRQIIEKELYKRGMLK
jgi:hypothetical protein